VAATIKRLKHESAAAAQEVQVEENKTAVDVEA
jgi:hypothetical protein